jgi:hypothetical protein
LALQSVEAVEVDVVAARAPEGALEATADLVKVLHAAAAAAKEVEETELGTGTEVLPVALAHPEFLCPFCLLSLPTTRLSTTDRGQTWTTSQSYSWRRDRP